MYVDERGSDDLTGARLAVRKIVVPLKRCSRAGRLLPRMNKHSQRILVDISMKAFHVSLGLREAPEGTYTVLSTIGSPFICELFPHPRLFTMSYPNPLKQFHCLDSAFPTFHDQVCNILYGKEYMQWVPTVQGDDLVVLVDYLDKVRYPISLFPFPA